MDNVKDWHRKKKATVWHVRGTIVATGTQECVPYVILLAYKQLSITQKPLGVAN
jgi:hypothetical protein